MALRPFVFCAQFSILVAMAATAFFEVEDLKSEFSILQDVAPCPGMITHHAFAPFDDDIPDEFQSFLQRNNANVTNLFHIPHEQISHDGVRCTSNGSLIVVQTSEKLPNASRFTGFEEDVRTCGLTTVSAGTYVVFARAGEKVFQTMPGRPYMAFGLVNGSPQCLYAGPQLESVPVRRPCFAADATVELSDGSSKRMDEIRLGDTVQVGPNLFSDVFMFSHHDPNTEFTFVEIRTDKGHTLQLTSGHFMYCNGKPTIAGSVRVGDVVEIENGDLVPVTSVRAVVNTGLYNPQTIHGDIIVNSVRCLTYTTAVEPNVAHSLLAPLRALYRLDKEYSMRLTLQSTNRILKCTRFSCGIQHYKPTLSFQENRSGGT